MHEVWVIYDNANKSYLAGGSWSALSCGRAGDPLEAHHYVNLSTARKMLKRLNGEIDKANQQTQRHLLPIWHRPEDQNNYYDHPVLVQPILCIHRIHSPQIEVVDL